MGMTRQERISLHKKQERLQIGDGVPSVRELDEAVPALRKTSEGLVEYLLVDETLYKKVLTKNELIGSRISLGIKDEADKIVITIGSKNADLTLEGGKIALKETTTPTSDTGYGKIYTKSDNKLYFQDGGGTEHEIDFA